MNLNRIPKVEMYANQNIQPPSAPSVQVLHQVQQSAHVPGQLPSAKDEEKMPLFLIKLWNIVEDPQYQQIIRWDESGCSFHIVDPYSFCRNVLPHYFKHNNLNSLIRQLNMYGFRKMSPLDKGGLMRSESDQDHLEFSHPHFIRDRPDLLVYIKRKQSGRPHADAGQSGPSAHNNLQMVMEELRQLKEKQRHMDAKMNDMSKENEALWEQLDHVRTQHTRQQQVVNKLVQFLIAIVQPNLSKRVLKRGILAIDETPTTPSKRARMGGMGGNNLADLLDRLRREVIDTGGGVQQNYNQSTSRGPIIADVTDGDDLYGNHFSPNGTNEFLDSSPNVNSPPSYHNSMSGNSPTMQVQQPSYSNSRAVQPIRSTAGELKPYANPRKPSRSAAPQYSNVNSSTTRTSASQYYQQPVEQKPTTTAYRPPTTNAVSVPMQNNFIVQPSTSANQNTGNLSGTIAANLAMSPALERQISQELQSGLGVLQEYLNGVDMNIDNCRELLNGNFDLDFLEDLADDTTDKAKSTIGHQLALEQGPSHSSSTSSPTNMFGQADNNLYVPTEVDHTVEVACEPSPEQLAHMNPQDPIFGDVLLSPNDPNIVDNQIFYPTTPDLLTPHGSPR